MKIAMGADHGGFILKDILKNHLEDLGYEINDYGTYDTHSVDYPDVVKEVTAHVTNHENELGIIICGTGIGVCIAANKIHGIRAALCTDEYCARTSRNHNNANILCLGERVTGSELAKSITEAFLNAEFDGGRHQIRVDKIAELE